MQALDRPHNSKLKGKGGKGKGKAGAPEFGLSDTSAGEDCLLVRARSVLGLGQGYARLGLC